MSREPMITDPMITDPMTTDRAASTDDIGDLDLPSYRGRESLRARVADVLPG